VAFEAYLKIVAKKQGEIKGLSRQKPYQDQHVILAYSWGIDGNMESLGFQDLEQRSTVSGRRKHRPLVIRRNADYASAMLLGAMFSHEVLETVDMTIVAQEGEKPKLIVVKLTDAIIISLSHETDGWERAQERIELIYNEIEFTTYNVDVKTGQNKGQAMAMDTVPRSGDGAD